MYEVTVGRFRALVDEGKGTRADPPAPGDLRHPLIEGSGWDVGFTGNLPADSTGLRAELKCIATYPAWTDDPRGNETLPMTCLSWFEAFAFCAWDGDRLPTELEWNYAAAEGSDQPEYPWGADADGTKARYDCTCDGSGTGACAFTDMLRVGSKSPQGDGKWGQADLAGSVWEWPLDWYRTPYLSSCSECSENQPAAERVNRGGSFDRPSSYLATSFRGYDPPTRPENNLGYAGRGLPP